MFMVWDDFQREVRQCIRMQCHFCCSEMICAKVGRRSRSSWSSFSLMGVVSGALWLLCNTVISPNHPCSPGYHRSDWLWLTSSSSWLICRYTFDCRFLQESLLPILTFWSTETWQQLCRLFAQTTSYERPWEKLLISQEIWIEIWNFSIFVSVSQSKPVVITRLQNPRLPHKR